MPTPKPLAAHVADGTVVPCRHANRLDAEYQGDPSATYSHAEDEDGRYLFDLLMTSLPTRVLAKADEPTIEAACRAWSEWKYLDRVLKTVKPGTAQYGVVQKQWVTALDAFDSFAKRFGMTPADRSRIKIGESSGEKLDPLEQELANRGNFKVVS